MGPYWNGWELYYVYLVRILGSVNTFSESFHNLYVGELPLLVSNRISLQPLRNSDFVRFNTMATAVIYTAPECPHSKKLKEFLNEKGVQYEEKCVLTNPGTFEELAKISGHKAIPVTAVGDDIFVGFDKRVERRLGRRLGG